MEKNSSEKTAFWTKYGLFQYKAMPFGLCNAPATFQRAMENVLLPVLHSSAVVYIDDIIVFFETLEEHREHVTEVLELLKAANLKVNSKKCAQIKNELKVLGFVIDGDGVKIDNERYQKIQNLQAPSSIKEVQQVLSLFSFCRRFIPGFAREALPMTALLKKDQSFHRRAKENECFERMKRLFLENGFLAYPDWSKPFVLYTDASAYALGATLCQEEKLVAAISRKLSSAERNYSTTEREALAIVWALKKFRCYLLGGKFTIKSDHRCLRSLSTIADPSGRVARWLATLAEYELEIEYIEGRKNTVADCLSRSPVGEVLLTRHFGQNQIDFLDELKKFLITGQMPQSLPKPVKGKLLRAARTHYVKGASLFKIKSMSEDVEVINDEGRKQEILHKTHRLGHASARAMFEEIFDNFYWPDLYSDCKKAALSCEVCQTAQMPKFRPSSNTFDACGIFEVFHLDFVRPLKGSREGNLFSLVGVDRFSKLVLARPYKEASSASVLHFTTKEIILRYGPPVQIVTDRGAAFLSEACAQFWKQNGISHVRTTAYYPQANGQVERYNGVLKQLLAKLCREKRQQWDILLPLAVFMLQIRKISRKGLSPFEIVHGVPGIRKTKQDIKNTKNEFSSLISRVDQLRKIETARALIEQKQELERCKAQGIEAVQDLNPEDRVTLWQPGFRATAFGQTQWVGQYTISRVDDYGNFYLINAQGITLDAPINASRLRKLHSP